MTKEITKAHILQEMEDKFGLRELIPERFRFSEEVVPVYQIEQHLEKWHILYAQISITSGPDPFLVATVPGNEKWHLRAYDIIFMAAGAYKVTGLYILRTVNRWIYLDMKLGQTVSYHIDLQNPVVMEPGNELYVYIDDYTSTANVRIYADYRVEEIR